MEEVKFACNEVLIQYLESQPIHGSQSIRFTERGGIVTLNIIVTFELVQMLSGWAHEVKVLQPKSLINELKDRHQMAINNYK